MNIKLNTLVDVVQEMIETSNLLLGRIEKLEHEIETWVQRNHAVRIRGLEDKVNVGLESRLLILERSLADHMKENFGFGNLT